MKSKELLQEEVSILSKTIKRLEKEILEQEKFFSQNLNKCFDTLFMGRYNGYKNYKEILDLKSKYEANQTLLEKLKEWKEKFENLMEEKNEKIIEQTPGMFSKKVREEIQFLLEKSQIKDYNEIKNIILEENEDELDKEDNNEENNCKKKKFN